MKLTALFASAAMVLGLATGAVAQDKTKIGFVYVGPVGDGGWTYEHDQARQAVVAEFGDKVETVFVESVPEGPDSERVMPPPFAPRAGPSPKPARHRPAFWCIPTTPTDTSGRPMTPMPP